MILMRSYVKDFDNFKKGILEVRKMIPFIDGIIGESDVEKDIVYNMIEEIKHHYPSQDNPDYPNVPAFSISALEVAFKTNGYCSFGWRIVRGKNHRRTKYSFRISMGDGRCNHLNFKMFSKNGWVEIGTQKPSGRATLDKSTIHSKETHDSFKLAHEKAKPKKKVTAEKVIHEECTASAPRVAVTKSLDGKIIKETPTAPDGSVLS